MTPCVLSCETLQYIQYYESVFFFHIPGSSSFANIPLTSHLCCVCVWHSLWAQRYSCSYAVSCNTAICSMISSLELNTPNSIQNITLAVQFQHWPTPQQTEASVSYPAVCWLVLRSTLTSSWMFFTRFRALKKSCTIKTDVK